MGTIYVIVILKSIYYPTEFEVNQNIERYNNKQKARIRDHEKSGDQYQIADLSDEEYKDSHPILGCLATLTGAIFVGLSYVLQKKGNMTEAELSKLNRKDDLEILVTNENINSSRDNLPVYCKLI